MLLATKRIMDDDDIMTSSSCQFCYLLFIMKDKGEEVIIVHRTNRIHSTTSSSIYTRAGLRKKV